MDACIQAQTRPFICWDRGFESYRRLPGPRCVALSQEPSYEYRARRGKDTVAVSAHVTSQPLDDSFHDYVVEGGPRRAPALCRAPQTNNDIVAGRLKIFTLLLKRQPGELGLPPRW